jgi:TetR/AcrR family transcriptional regulator, cholesterol catabolism regulator
MELEKKAKERDLQKKAAPKPKRKNKAPGKSALSRMQILDAAAGLFRRQGYSETTLRQIAKTAGMQAGSIYYHFDSKDEIVDEVLATGMREIYKLVEKTVATGGEEATYRERIERGMIAHLDLLLTKGDYFSSNIRLYGQIPEALKPRHLHLRQRYGRLWDQLLRQAQEAGEIRPDIKIVPLRMFMLGALNWTMEWFDPHRYSVGDFARQINAVVFEGVRLEGNRESE